MGRHTRRWLIAALLIAAPRVLPAQEAGSTADIAQLLALEDRKTFDPAVMVRESQHPDSLVRRYAAMVMGRIGDHAAAPLLRRLLTDPDSLVRTEAAFACGSLGDRGLVADLAQLAARFAPQSASDFDAEVVTALARLGGAEAEAALGAIFERHPASSSNADRATTTVLQESWRLGRRSPLLRSLPDYIRSSNADWRRAATYSAYRARFAGAASALLEAAQDNDQTTRSYAARALIAATADSGGVSREAFLSRVRALVNDDDPQVRVNALRALATFEDSTLAPLAIARLVDRDPNVPIQAAATLGSLKGSPAAQTLAQQFPSAGTYGLRRAMLFGLAAVAPARALETGRAWKTDADFRERMTWAELLGAARTPESRAQLVEMLADADARVAGAALGALEAMTRRGDTALVALATARLASPDVGVRATAISILGRERNPLLLPQLMAALQRAQADPLGEARLAALRAVADIADSVPGSRAAVEQALFLMPRPRDYILRRLAADRFGEAATRRWGPATPVESGRSAEEYRDIARRYVLGAAPPGNISIETDRGTIVMQLFAFDAPLTVDNFVRLVDRHFFDNGRWHRVVPNFVIQDGDPRGDGSGGPGTQIRDEINRQRYQAGTVGMALSGPDTGGSQFFITHSPQPHLDGGYTVFGQVVAGWDAVAQVVQGDRIRRIFR